MATTSMNFPSRRVFLAALLLGAMLLTAFGVTERLLGTCGLDGLTSKNEAYLESSFERSLRTFAVLSTIKVGLAVVEGTEIGVGFGLQVGDVVQAAYDYVDIAWRTVLAAGVILLATRTLLEAAALLNHWLLAGTLAAFVLMILTQEAPPRLARTHRMLREAALFMTVLTAACYLVLPLSIAGGAYLSGKITAPSIEEAESGLSALGEDLFPEGETADGGLGSRWTQIKDRLNHMASYLKEKASELTVWILKLIAGYLFDCLVFPLGLFALLVWFTRVMAKGLFE
jgi:NADH:ubiquinone oxidoreductase subunit 6 (subunit J)